MSMRSQLLLSSFAIIALAFLSGCGQEATAPETQGALPAEPVAVETIELGELARARAFGDFVFASQPSAADLAQAKSEHGIKTVLNLRMPEELGDFDEAAAVKELGLGYEHRPFSGPDTLDDALFGELVDLLDDSSKRPLFVHCKSANRVGAIWYAYRVLREGISEEQAMTEAKTIGLRKEGHIERARAYAAAKKKS
jgi:protein tyrosine phosphatase (PTP) superfamily phosphohydrolase (DUF442 family)